MNLRNWSARAASVGALSAVMVSASLAGAQATDGADALSPSDEARVSAALGELGATPEQVADVLADPSLIALVPVSSTVDTTVTTAEVAPLAFGQITPLSIGSDCSGTSKTRQKSYTSANVYGITLFTSTLKTRWCYNSSRVTYASNVLTGNVSSFAALGGWSYVDHDVDEAWGVYNGKTNGRVYSDAQFDYQLSPIKIGGVSSGTHYISSDVRYTGSSTGASSCSGLC